MSTAAECAKHLTLSARRFHELVDAGAITRAPPKAYDLDKVRGEYVQHLRKYAAGMGHGRLDLAQQRALLARAQREATELRNSITRGELVRVRDVADVVAKEYGLIRDRLLAVPGKVADACAMKPREVVETLVLDEINEALAELSDASEIAAKAR